jgi:ABC-type Fe3+ transport system substrate-binding protein
MAEAGLIDPERWYTPYAVYSHVLMIDLARLADLPVPQRWSDLLNPIYANHIICDGAHDTRFSPVPILHYYKEHGEDGLIQLAGNIRDTWHPAEMVKAAGSADKKAAAIYIVPWSFARAKPASKTIRIVWPQEGAIASPIYAWVKAKGGEGVQLLAQALIGEKLGRKAAQAGFPSLNPNVNNRLPPEASFCWLGWDYIRRHDIQKLIETTDQIAERAWMAKAA